MPRPFVIAAAISIGLLWTVTPRAVRAQAPVVPAECRPPAPAAAHAPIMFTEEQENDLGDAIDEHVGREFRVVDDDDLTTYLRQVGDRLVRHLPPTKLHFQFFLIDLPEANAMEMPGGRVYVSRKLVALTKDENELASVMAHELGHLVARQQAAYFTKLFKDVLNVSSVADRADIFEKYNQLMDNAAKRPSAFKKSEDTEQLEADQMGLFAAAAAGYDPQAGPRVLDRLMGTKGDTGGFFSNLFGTTNRDSLRLRDLIKNSHAIPPACIDPRPVDSSAFDTWRNSVIAFTGLSRKESVPGVITRTVLEPPLRGEIASLKFSPDGRTVLAQDDGGISVLSRDPFQLLFRIDATGVASAQFTPDSKQIVFHTSDSRVERWDVASKRMAEIHEVHLTHPCLQLGLSPDGKVLACVEMEAEYTRYGMLLIDVDTADPIAEFKEWTSATPVDFRALNALGPAVLLASNYHYVEMNFSPDGRYLVAAKARGGIMGTSAGDDVLMYDLPAKQPVLFKADSKKFLAEGFAFTGPATVVAINRLAPKESVTIHLPDGAITDHLTVFNGDLEPATKGPFVFVRPFQKFSVGVLDLEKRAVVKGLPNSAIDIYGDVFVAERGTGELGLYGIDNALKAAVTLPRASLNGIRAAAVSEDFKWLAVSSRARGILWDAAKGQSVTQTREFSGATFSADDVFVANFPRAKEEPHAVMRIDPTGRVPPATTEIRELSSTQVGPYLLVRSPAVKGGNLRDGQILEVRDAGTGASLWQKTFATEPPDQWLASRAPEAMVLSWRMTSKIARDEVKKDPVLSKKPAAGRPVETDYFVRIVDMRTGNTRGQMLFETGGGSFDLSNATVVGDVLTLGDNENRVRLYSVKTGDTYGRVFGSRTLVSPGGDTCLVENSPGHLTIYDVATLKKRQSYVFSHGVTLTRFSPDGSKLFVLTSDQAAYVIGVK